MKVEVDVSELEWGAYYKDEKCKEVEGILQGNPQYAECEVKRGRYEDNQSEDPFCVLDEKGEAIAILDRWEVYALNGSELLAYFEVDQTRNRGLDRLESVKMLFIWAIGFPLVGLVMAVLFFFFGDDSLFSLAIYITAFSSILTPLVGILYYSMSRSTTLRKKNADLDAVRKNPSFVDMLRRLAEAPEADEIGKRQLLERVKDIEEALAGANSQERNNVSDASLSLG